MARPIPVAIAVVALFGAATALAQSAQLPSFEVASVRLNPNGTVSSSRIIDVRVDINLPLRWIVLQAFRLSDYQLIAPDWLNEGLVDIHASLPSGAMRQQVPEMLQRLLSDRFGLVTHREVRPMDGYELVVAQDGIRMREVEPLDELTKEFPLARSSSATTPRDTITETVDGPVRTMSVPRGSRRVTSRTMWERTINNSGGGIINASRMTMAELVPWLWENLDAPVVDKTGLTGVYEFKLELPPDARADRVMQSLGMNTNRRDPTGGVSTFKAVEGLGLKLERRRLPIEIIVVDRISRVPTDN